jgi:hypothetical protein
VCKPGTLKTYKKFEAEINVLTKIEGGCHSYRYLMDGVVYGWNIIFLIIVILTV